MSHERKSITLGDDMCSCIGFIYIPLMFTAITVPSVPSLCQLSRADPWQGPLRTIVPLSHQQVSPWPFKGLAISTKKAEQCCFKPLQAQQILSCCFLTGPTQPGTACLTLWLLMSESTCSLSLCSLLPFPSLSTYFSLSMSSLVPPRVS